MEDSGKISKQTKIEPIIEKESMKDEVNYIDKFEGDLGENSFVECSHKSSENKVEN